MLGYEIKDLYYDDITAFKTILTNWAASEQIDANYIYTQCEDGYHVVGGPNILGSSTKDNTVGDSFTTSYSGLPTHDTILFSFTFLIFGDWSSVEADGFHIMFDDTKAVDLTIDSQNVPYGMISCETSSSLAAEIRVSGQIAHSGSSLGLTIVSNLNHPPREASFGFRDINFIFRQTTQTLPISTAVEGVQSIPTNPLPASACPTGQYESPAGSGECRTCHTSCDICYGPSNQQCVQCAPGFSYNGKACIRCHQFCSQCFGEGQDECTGCTLENYLFGSNTCLDYCESTLLTATDDGGQKLCQNNYCSDPSQWIVLDSAGSSAPSLPMLLRRLGSTSTSVPSNIDTYTGKTLYFYLPTRQPIHS